MLRVLTLIAALTVATGAYAQGAAGDAAPAKAAAAKDTKATKEPSGNVAVVNKVPIKRAELEVILRQLKQPDTPELRKAITQRLIEMEVLTQEANKRKLLEREDVKFQVENARRQTLIQALIRDETDAHKLTDDEVKAEYDREVAAAAGELEYKAHHILVDSEDGAKAIIEKLDKGEKFEDLAKASKDTGSGANGGALDWSPAAGYVKEFSDAMIALKKGEYTKVPVKTQFGYHVIRLDDSRPITPPSFDSVKSRFTEQLQQKQVRDFVDSLVKKADIK